MKAIKTNIALLFLLNIFLLYNPVENQGQQLYYSNGIYFEEFYVDNGLPNYNFYSLLQDSNGFIWGGGSDVLLGNLVKYDGYNLSVFGPSKDFPHRNKIRDKPITALHEDQYGCLWFGTTGTGLSRFDPETTQFFHYPYEPDDFNSITAGQVTAIVGDDQGGIWVGTKGGLSRVEFDLSFPDSLKKVKQFHESDSLEIRVHENFLLSDKVQDIYLDKNQNLWIGTIKGLSKFELNKNKNKDTIPEYHFEHFPKRDNGLTSLHFTSVSAISSGLSGSMWIAGMNIEKDGKTTVCLDLYNPSTGKFHPIPFKEKIGKRIMSIAQTQNGDLWLATDGEGLKKITLPSLIWPAQKGILDPLSFETYDFGMNQGILETRNRIMDLLVDHSGTLWIGTFSYGIFKLPYTFNRFPYNEILVDQGGNITVNYVMEDSRGNIWVSTLEQGLYKWDKHKNSYTNFSHNPVNSKSIIDNSVRCVFEDSKGRLWVSTDKGLCRFDESNSTFYNYQHIPNSPESFSFMIFEDNNGILWIAGWGGGLYLFDPENEKFWHYKAKPDSEKSLINNVITQIYEDSEQTIWVATFYGLHKVLNPNKEVLNYDSLSFERQMVGEKVLWVHEDKQNRFWVSSFFRGLLLYDRFEEKVSKSYYYRGPEGYPFNVVNSIEEDDSGNLWLFGGLGIVKFDHTNENFQLFNKSSGISNAPSGRIGKRN
ncbi:MAG: hypothetical protein GY705_24140, partial [Bacteroidetes bacterium]|nr:hypothetical protein [Bacteroidota bacterium]